MGNHSGALAHSGKHLVRSRKHGAQRVSRIGGIRDDEAAGRLIDDFPHIPRSGRHDHRQASRGRLNRGKRVRIEVSIEDESVRRPERAADIFGRQLAEHANGICRIDGQGFELGTEHAIAYEQELGVSALGGSKRQE